MTPHNEWSEYEKLVMYRLDTLDANMKEVLRTQSNLKTQVTRLRTISSILGALAGGAAGLLGLFFNPGANK